MQLAIFLSRGLVVETFCSCMFGAINQVYKFKKLSPVADGFPVLGSKTILLLD